MSLNVFLAGYNIDADTIKELKTKANWEVDNLTPETLSASYARISRDPRPINELRTESREKVAKARKSNEAIIFGLGHSSVAEHAYFNFDIIGLSRLAVEEVQKFRMASFTEKSQRYITLNGDFVIPEEIKAMGEQIVKEYKNVIDLQNKTYFYLYEKLKTFLFAKHSETIKTKQGASTVDGYAKEDARYVLSLATETQFGMSVNARSLENMLKSFSASDLSEIRQLGKDLYEKVSLLSPSIIKYVEASSYDLHAEKDLKDFVSGLFLNYKKSEKLNFATSGNTRLLAVEDELRFFSLIIATSLNINYENAFDLAETLTDSHKKEMLKLALGDKKFYEPVLPFFEFLNYKFETKISATNYAQFKRHRVSSQFVLDYDINLDVTIPENIKKIGEEKLFKDVIKKTNDFYKKLENYNDKNIANYILTNAHNRKVIFNMNLRELYHFFSLRLDAHAQWDIKITAKEMLDLIKQQTPHIALMCCGKHEYDDYIKKLFTDK